jgi:FixJ family two-component response regulator
VESRIGVLVTEHGSGTTPGSMSGQRLHAQLEIDLGARLPVVFMCSDPTHSTVVGGRRDMLFLQKPFEIPELMDAVTSVIAVG